MEARLVGHSVTEPIQVQNINDVIAVAAVDGSSQAVRADGSVWAWGDNGSVWSMMEGASGRLQVRDLEGDNLWFGNINRPRQVMNIDGVTAISSNTFRNRNSEPRKSTAVLRHDNTVWTWGNSNSQGQLGNGTYRSVMNLPTQVLNNAIAISAGSQHTLALRSDGTVYTWGRNAVNNFGSVEWVYFLEPERVHGLSDIIDIAASNHNLALRDDGTVWAWGSGNSGQFGDGVYGYRWSMGQRLIVTPVQVVGDGGVGHLNLFVSSPPLNVPSSWAQDYIERAHDLSLIPISLYGNYQQNITRAEFCMLAARLFREKGGTFPISIPIEFLIDPNPILSHESISFDSLLVDPNILNLNDIQHLSGEKQAAILRMVSIGVVTGVYNNQFNPNDGVTRQEAAVMLGRLMERLNYRFQPTVSSFTDINTAAEWARPHIANMEVAGIMRNSNGLFDPHGKFTREQAIATIMRIWDLSPPQDDIIDGGVNKAILIARPAYSTIQVYLDDYWTNKILDSPVFTVADFLSDFEEVNGFEAVANAFPMLAGVAASKYLVPAIIAIQVTEQALGRNRGNGVIVEIHVLVAAPGTPMWLWIRPQ